MVTQKEVAKRAGVSFITVSRVINNLGNVKEETRKRVQEAIETLNYHPNHLGQALNSGRNNTIGIVTPIRFEGGLEANMYLIGILDGIERACRERRLDMLLTTESIKDKDFDFLRPYHQRKVDGVLFIGLQQMSAEQIREIEVNHIPCVAIGDRPTSTAISWVDSDNELAGYTSTLRLLELGHQRIAFLGVDPGRIINQNIQDRLNGYKRALDEAQITCCPDWLLHGDFSTESGKAAFSAISAMGANRPTAIFCGNDSMAIGVMQEALAQGFRVPEDLAIVGFDAFTPHRMTNPQLTSNQQPLSEMGYIAANLLIDHIMKPESPRETVIKPISLVDGETAPWVQ